MDKTTAIARLVNIRDRLRGSCYAADLIDDAIRDEEVISASEPDALFRTLVLDENVSVGEAADAFSAMTALVDE